MSARLLIGDVYDRMTEIPDGSIDLVVTSPPFLALRSYLPADHPLKAKEIGSEATPADFLDTLLALTAEWGRVLAPHGSIAVELGDTFSGSGGGGGDYLPGGLREDQPGFGGSAEKQREGNAAHWRQKNQNKSAWPLPKSLTGIPTLYAWSLAYGRNLLTGEESPAGQWRIRNLICWARPNPPVGALGDKFRPATSYITVATRASDRWFDLDAVRTPSDYDRPNLAGKGSRSGGTPNGQRPNAADHTVHPAGAPPLDWHADEHPEDGDWLWNLPTQPYKGAHYATFPKTLPKRLIEAMCPRQVCEGCGEPRRRIVEKSPDYAEARAQVGGFKGERSRGDGLNGTTQYVEGRHMDRAENVTTGWTTCDCPEPTYRTGIVLDPFAGSGTTLEVATGLGRDCIGIDLDERNADLARDRVGMFLEVVA